MAPQPPPASPTPRRAAGRRSPAPVGPFFFAIVALIAFAIGLAILSVMLWNAQLLISLGLTGNYYYVVLLALGLSAAAFLFGVLQSSARYRGETGWGALELGGPIVGAALVVVGGFFLVPNPTSFDLSVFVHGHAGAHDLLPKDSGEVVMKLGSDVRRRLIGENGEAFFAGIPSNFRGQEAPIWVESQLFESVSPDQNYSLKGAPISLEVRRKGGTISGRVQDENGKPLSGAKLEAAGVSVTSDAAGHFEITIAGDRLKPSFDLVAEAAGYSTRHYEAVPNSNDLVIALTPEK